MSQTTYNIAYPVGANGMIADSVDPWVPAATVASGLCGVGLLCSPGTDSMTGPALTLPVLANGVSPGQCKALTAGLVANPMIDSVWWGIPIYDATLPPYDNSLTYSAYTDKQMMTIMVKGDMYVTPEAGAIVNQQDAFVRTAAGGSGILGKWAPAAGAGIVTFTRGRYVSGLMQSGTAILRIW